MPFDFKKIIPVSNLVAVILLSICVLVLFKTDISVKNQIELHKIEEQLKILNERKPIETKILIIDNETADKIRNIDSLTRDESDSLFSRFDKIKRIPGYRKN